MSKITYGPYVQKMHHMRGHSQIQVLLTAFDKAHLATEVVRYTEHGIYLAVTEGSILFQTLSEAGYQYYYERETEKGHDYKFLNSKTFMHASIRYYNDTKLWELYVTDEAIVTQMSISMRGKLSDQTKRVYDYLTAIFQCPLSTFRTVAKDEVSGARLVMTLTNADRRVRAFGAEALLNIVPAMPNIKRYEYELPNGGWLALEVFGNELPRVLIGNNDRRVKMLRQFAKLNEHLSTMQDEIESIMHY